MSNNQFVRDFSYLHRYQIGEERDWRKTDSFKNPRRVIEKSAKKRTAKRNAMYGVLSMIVIVVFLIALLMWLLHDQPDESRTCVPGFTGSNCERSSFLGTYVWSTTEFYKLDDGLDHCQGIAFRVYAPLAKSVNVLTKPRNGVETAYSMMYGSYVALYILENKWMDTGFTMSARLVRILSLRTRLKGKMDRKQFASSREVRKCSNFAWYQS